MPRQSTPNLSRRRDLERAIKRAKPGDLLRLEDLAAVWGVVKTRFVNVKNDITMTIGFPEHKPGPNNTHLYPAAAALKKMLAYETRNDQQSAARQKRAAQILGQGSPRKGIATIESLHAPSELATLSRLAAEVEAREREQGLYIPNADVANTAADMFSLMSETCSQLANKIDPNGLLAHDVRTAIDKAGRALLVQLHTTAKEMLNADRATVERPAGRARGARARR